MGPPQRHCGMCFENRRCCLCSRKAVCLRNRMEPWGSKTMCGEILDYRCFDLYYQWGLSCFYGQRSSTACLSVSIGVRSSLLMTRNPVARCFRMPTKCTHLTFLCSVIDRDISSENTLYTLHFSLDRRCTVYVVIILCANSIIFCCTDVSYPDEALPTLCTPTGLVSKSFYSSILFSVFALPCCGDRTLLWHPSPGA